MNYLHTNFPAITEKLPYIQLGDLPTPVERLKNLGFNDHLSLYIKRDDISGTIYGGNKVRKLEFILADAIQKGAKRVITTGVIGSNHALAVARYSVHLGLKPVLMLFGDQRGEHVKMNLLADRETGAEMYYDTTFEEHQKSMIRIIDHYKKVDNCEPYIIPAGGTSNIGIAGYINAAFELNDQIGKKEIPAPDAIYLPFGTMGTAAGLLLGAKVIGLQCKIIPVQVVASFVADEKKYASLVRSANEFYHSLDKSFPVISFEEDDFRVNKEYLGPGYGISTKQTEQSIKFFLEREEIKLDSVYSGKAASAFLDHCKENSGKRQNVLFWNTKNSIPINTNEKTFEKLPPDFQKFF